MHKVLMIHKEFSGVVVNGELYGSQCGSRLTSNSMAMVKFQNTAIPCFIQNFFKVSAISMNDAAYSCSDVYIVSVTKLTLHSQRCYCGSPVEVWQHNFEEQTEDCDF